MKWTVWGKALRFRDVPPALMSWHLDGSCAVSALWTNMLRKSVLLFWHHRAHVITEQKTCILCRWQYRASRRYMTTDFLLSLHWQFLGAFFHSNWEKASRCHAMSMVNSDFFLYFLRPLNPPLSIALSCLNPRAANWETFRWFWLQETNKIQNFQFVQSMHQQSFDCGQGQSINRTIWTHTNAAILCILQKLFLKNAFKYFFRIWLFTTMTLSPRYSIGESKPSNFGPG